jgi:hypothetical protein
MKLMKLRQEMWKSMKLTDPQARHLEDEVLDFLKKTTGQTDRQSLTREAAAAVSRFRLQVPPDSKAILDKEFRSRLEGALVERALGRHPKEGD